MHHGKWSRNRPRLGNAANASPGGKVESGMPATKHEQDVLKHPVPAPRPVHRSDRLMLDLTT